MTEHQLSSYDLIARTSDDVSAALAVRELLAENARLRAKADQFDVFIAAILATEPHAKKPRPHVEALLDIVTENKRLRKEIERLRSALIAIEYAIQQTLGPILYGSTNGGNAPWGDETAETLVSGASREIERLRGEIASAEKTIADRGVCEQDCTLPLAARIDNLILDLRTESHEWATVQVENERLRGEVDRLRLEITGYQKANSLLMKGMESQSELMDGMKQEVRQLRARVAELEAR